LLETIFQSIQEGVIVVDGKGQITYANRAAEQFLGFSAEAFQGKPIARYLRTSTGSASWTWTPANGPS